MCSRKRLPDDELERERPDSTSSGIGVTTRSTWSSSLGVDGRATASPWLSSSDKFCGEPFSGSSIASSAITRRFAAKPPRPPLRLSVRVGVAIGPGVEWADEGVGGGRAKGSSCSSFGSTSQSVAIDGAYVGGTTAPGITTERSSEPTELLRRRVDPGPTLGVVTEAAAPELKRLERRVADGDALMRRRDDEYEPERS